MDYTVSKATLIGLGKYLAAYFPERAFRVNCLAIGEKYDCQDSDVVRNYNTRIQLRSATVSEVLVLKKTSKGVR